MSKRRRTPSIASRSVDEDTNESDSQSIGVMETTRKKRKLDPVRIPLRLILNFYLPLIIYGSIFCNVRELKIFRLFNAYQFPSLNLFKLICVLRLAIFNIKQTLLLNL